MPEAIAKIATKVISAMRFTRVKRALRFWFVFWSTLCPAHDFEYLFLI